MADDKSKRGSADRARVGKMEDYEVRYLAQKHGTTQKAVKNAVDKVGNSRNKVEAELKADNKAASAAKAAKSAAKKAQPVTNKPAKRALPGDKLPRPKTSAPSDAN